MRTWFSCCPVLALLLAGVAAMASTEAASRGPLACDSGPARAELKLQAIRWMKNDQLLDEMADLGSADMSLSHVVTGRISDEVLACSAKMTLRVMYSAGLRRTIDNQVTYDLRQRDEEGRIAVHVRTFGKIF